MGMHDDKCLNRNENQKTYDDDNIFLTLAKLDSPELRKFLMLGIGANCSRLVAADLNSGADHDSC